MFFGKSFAKSLAKAFRKTSIVLYIKQELGKFRSHVTVHGFFPYLASLLFNIFVMRDVIASEDRWVFLLDKKAPFEFFSSLIFPAYFAYFPA